MENKISKPLLAFVVMLALAFSVLAFQVVVAKNEPNGNTKIDDNLPKNSGIDSDNAASAGQIGTGQQITAQTAGDDTAKQMKEIKDMIVRMQKDVQEMKVELKNQTEMIASLGTQRNEVDPTTQAKAGIIITGAVSGPGYPTGPLNMTWPASQLLLDRIGAVKQGVGSLEVKDRQYEAPLETIPPTFGAFPITINGVANTATELKVISNMKLKNGIGQHQGTIDADIDTIPTGHVTLQYSGTATQTGTTITSKGTFKTSKTTGIFAGLVAEGTYTMTITETGQTFGSPVTVSLTTVSP